MCGIAGWANKDSNQTKKFGDEALLHSMCERMEHRGPDSEGLWLEDGVALGMRRLSIIDLHTGEQPVYSEDKSIVAIMNGEIYNFWEIRKDLEKRGHKFVTQTDTEVIPHLYEEFGEDFVDSLNGMFAIALWDKNLKKLVITRDRFGEKPLYYGIFDDKLFFASELKVLLAHSEINPEINLEALNQYLSYDYVPAPLSIFEGIYKLPAAHKLIWKDGGFEIDRYWDLDFQKKTPKPTVNEATEQLQDLLSESVKMRLISDVPLGILLSGGIDSSAVAAFAVRHSTEKVKTFSIGFEEDSFDESKYAREVAAHLGTEHYEDILSVETAADLISEIGSWLDEPLSDGSLLPTFLLSRFVRRYVTVALGGDGGDEIFAGYPMYFAHKVAKIYNTIPQFIRSGLIEPVTNNLPVSTNNLSFDYKAKRFIASANHNQIERHHSWFGSFSGEQKEKLLGENVKSSTSNLDIYKRARELANACNAENKIEKMQYLDMNFYLAEDILTKVDRASMAVSLEVRAPFLDHKVAEFASSLPFEYKLKGRNTKYILKQSVKDLIPQSIINRPKKGFGIPIAEWLKGRLNPLMNDMLSAERINKQGFFDSQYVEKLIKNHEKGISNNYKQLWTLLVFQIWFEKFGK